MKTSWIAWTVLAGLVLAQGVLAQPSDRKTKVTFSAPFEIPAPSTNAGVLALPAGTYVFSLVDSQSNRHIVRVTNEQQNRVYTTILAIPDYRLNATSKTVMYFSERGSGAPMAVKSWFYPGDNYGQRFVYPKSRAVAIATAVNEPVPSLDGSVNMGAAVQVQTPAKTEVAYDAKLFEEHDSGDTAGVDGEAVKASSGGTLPKTASPVYGMGAAGLLLLALSFAVRGMAASRRTN